MRHRPFLLILGASALAMVGLAESTYWMLSLVGLALYLYVLWWEDVNVPNALLYGLIFGTMSAGGGAIWMLEAYPIARLGVSPLVGMLLVGGTWFLTALALGSGIALGSPLVVRMRRTWFAPLATAFLWIAMEQAGMWANAVYTWGPQSYFGPHFSPGAIGYALTEQPYLLQLAHPLGLIALTFAAALIAGTAASLPGLRQEGTRTGALVSLGVLAALLSLPALGGHQAPTPSSTLRFALLGANNDAEKPLDIASTTRSLLGEAAAGHPDVVVFPEGYGLGVGYPDRAERAATVTRLFPTETLVIDWAYYRTQEAYARGLPGADVLEYVSTARGVLATYRKVYLMPVGEYEPAIYTAIYGLFDSPGLHTYLAYMDHAIGRGDGVVAAAYRGGRIGGLLCSDLIDPYLYRALGAAGSDVLVNLGNQDWFHHSRHLYAKTIQIAKVAAVENRRPFVEANDGAPSFALDRNGRIIAASPWGSTGALFVDVPYP